MDTTVSQDSRVAQVMDDDTTRTKLAQVPAVITDTPSALDEAPQLVGQLGQDGIANLKIDRNATSDRHSTSEPPHSLKAALDAVAGSRGHNGHSDATSTASEEDYDNLRHDPQTMIMGGRGGGFLGSEEVSRIDQKVDTDSETTNSSKPKRPGLLSFKSIPVTLKKADEEGKYYLIADDVELKKLSKLSHEKDSKTNGKGTNQRSKFNDLVFTRQFTAFDRQSSAIADSPFHGFFILFWLGTAVFMVRLAGQNWAAYGNIFGSNEIINIMLHHDLLLLGLSDGVLAGSTGFGWILQKLILTGFITWNKEGWIIQSVWQILYTAAFISWTLYREWPWTHTVFFVLHGLVMLMKQHSYAFYNGYLSEAYRNQQFLLRRLKQLDSVAPAQSPSETVPTVSSLSTSYLDERPPTGVTGLHQRRQSMPNNKKGLSEIQQVAAAIVSGDPLDIEQIQTYQKILKWEVDALSEDLKGKATTSSAYYPHNLTLSNHYEYIVMPTLVYELEYPRSDSIDWSYVAEKAIATVGILILMQLVSQSFIYPVVVRTNVMKETGVPLVKRLEAFPLVLSDLIFPFMGEYLVSTRLLLSAVFLMSTLIPSSIARPNDTLQSLTLRAQMVWYLIWENILNLLAELTYFADRGFYADWWNSISWDQFARDWNRPVHNFLLRHVYHSSISSMRVNKQTATLITFFLSACVHELVMWCLFKQLRGYLLFFQMLQLPLVQLSRSRWLRGRSTLGNLVFWFSIFTGPSLLCSLYLII
ncbi:MAG: acyl-CoA/sterol acyltransferase [Claussenomyces sp. TS43310]|nr:MAG: acyl-CoA/sterol acyltransferase [Claussenomyces sp. TS43310]